MPDKKKVIKGLKCCTKYEVGKQLNACMECPYVEPVGFNQFRCKSQEMKEDALKLIEGVKPSPAEIEGGCTVYWWVCGECHSLIRDGDKFCHECGGAILWE